MELELGLAPPTNSGGLLGELSGAAGVSASAPATCGGGKRGFHEAFEEEEEEVQGTATPTLPLFDDGSSSSSTSGSMRENKKALVGWPPVSSARSRACGGASAGRHVKVRKEGATIGRKVDLSLHGCYGDLLATLARMFPATATTGDQQAAGCPGSAAEKQDAGLVVTYEDGDGDWMLLGDVPWEDFARSVKRLKILL